MKKLILLAVSAVFLAGCAHSTGKVNKQVISGYSDKMPNEARVVGDLKVEIVKTVTLETDKPCSTLEFVKQVVKHDRTIHDVLNIRSEETYKYEYATDNSTKQHRVVLGCDYVGLGVRYVADDSKPVEIPQFTQEPSIPAPQPESTTIE